ncbi:MAG: TIGR02281 family clan AA aspartic protease [Parvularculaceae bacterium]
MHHAGEEVRIAAAPDRQYYVHADVNRRSARFLIDTGASYVALRDSDARAAGVYTSYTDYTYPVHTANGETKAAYVTLDEIEVGGIRIEGVKAFILQDEQLAVNLLGMSFLSRLESVEARKGELVLRG